MQQPYEKYAYRYYIKQYETRRQKRRKRGKRGQTIKKLWDYVWPVATGATIFIIIFAYIFHYARLHAEGLRFKNPWAFFLIPIILVTVVVSIFLTKEKSAKLTFTRIDVLKRIPGRTTARFFIFLPHALRTASMLLILLAIARPQATAIRQETEVEGIDIILTLDMSNSMKAADLKPMRLEAAKAVTDEFIHRRINDRIGVVIFGREAMTLCPLTLDYTVLRNLVRSLKLGTIDGRGTAIGNALGVAINRLRKSTAESKVIVLLTDGSNNQGNISPQQAAEFARTLGIKIYTVLVGKREETPVEIDKDFFGRSIYASARFPVNPQLLKRISKRTGGKFYTAQDKKALEKSFHDILNSLEKTTISDIGASYAETFPRYLLPALLLLFLEIVIRFTRGRKLP